MYESPRRSFRSSMDPLRLRITLRPCFSICEYPYEPAKQLTDRFTALYNSRPFLASANTLTNLLDNLRPLFGIYKHPYEPAKYKYTAKPLESLYRRL
jgi:hypothetical protein